MLYTMLTGQPPSDHMQAGDTGLASGGSSSAGRLSFPQQPVLSKEAKELLAALLRCASSSRRQEQQQHQQQMHAH
jgi:hypothetical protein